MTRKEQIEARKLELRSEIENAETEEQVEELEQEVEALTEEEGQIEEQEENQVIAEELEEQKSFAKEIKMEERKMENLEMKNTKEYISAYASYIKEGLDRGFEMSAEERALLTNNAENGQIAVPTLVDEIIRTAWEREEIMSLVKTISVKGNFQVQFEVSGTDAEIHEEGNPKEVDEEELVLGIVTLAPKSIKKWISVSDEALDMTGEAFLNYIYDELTYRIAKKSANILVGKIAALPQTLTANEEGVYDTVSANKVEAAPAVGTIAKAFANLSDEASKPVIIMNRLTFADFKEAKYNNSYAVDPFEGFEVKFNNTLPAYADAQTGQVYAILGDLSYGALANCPAGSAIGLKYDDKTLMTKDLVRILGRKFCAVEPVADKAFALITKPEEA